MIWDCLVERTGKYCSIRRIEYPEFQTGIFGRMESARNLPNSQFLLTGKICRIFPSDFFVRTYALATKHIAFLDLAFIIRRQNGHVSVPCQRPVLFNNPGIHDHSLPLDGRDLEKMLVVDTSNFNTFVSNSISFQGPLSWLLG